MRLKITLTFLFVLASFQLLHAQQEIKGRVLYDTDHNPVVGATVTLRSVDSPKILAYTKTSEDGSFQLKKGLLPDSIEVSVRSMTIEPQSKRVKGNIGFIEFLAVKKTTRLKEVIVRTDKIRQKGDTINYLVSSFLNETDQSIGDVLKKLPGIQVLSSGQILYQNKAINKFYIEGLDLLKGKYGIATQNVDASKVATVQVLENHQPIKALKDMEIPEEAAINLKLKESSKGAFFATAQLGIGLPDWLLSNELVGMRFARMQQNMLVYKGDNTGRDVSKELVSFYDDAKKATMNLLSLPLPPSPPIDAQHFLFNDAHVISLNDLHKLNKDLTLTGNLNFLSDRQKSSSYFKRDVFLQDADDILIEEDMYARLLKRELEGTITLEGNTDNYFLNNKLHVQSKWNQSKSDVLPNNADLVFQKLSRPELHLSNDFSYMLKKGDASYRAGAFVGYTNQDQTLRVSPSLFAPLLPDEEQNGILMKQNVLYDHFAAKAFFSGGIDKKISMSYTATVFTDQHKLRSSLYAGLSLDPLGADSLRNNYHRNEFGVTLNSTFLFKLSSSFKPQLILPISYLQVNRHDKIHQSSGNKGYLLFKPLLLLQLPVTSQLSLLSNLSFSNNIGGINEDYTGYIMNTYRTMNRADGLESKNNVASGFVLLSYKNPFTTLFASLYLSYTNHWSNMLRDIRYNGMLSSVTGIYHPNTTHTYDASLSLDKSIDAIRSEVKFRIGYNKSTSIAMNQRIVSKIDYSSYSLSPQVVTDIGKFMVVKYKASYRYGINTIEKEKSPDMHSLSQDLSMSFIPIKKLIFNLSFNHYFNNLIKSSDRSLWFGNVGVKYRLKNIDLMLDWNNIFNTKQFVQSSYSDVSSYYSVYTLRPSEVLFRVRFKIL